jgi:hypothetical protein
MLIMHRRKWAYRYVKRDCRHCDGTGKAWYSCCGDDMSQFRQHAEVGICPSCKEHIADDGEDCYYCDGAGYISSLVNNKSVNLIFNLKKLVK